MLPPPVDKRWSGRVVVAATGRSLTAEVAEACRGENVIAVNDAYRLFPDAAVLYACDALWWQVHKGCPGFRGERWSSHGCKGHNDKTESARRWGLRLVQGANGDGFSLDPSRIHYGSNSGFQAINLALLMGGNPVVLVGFDMRATGHFFGNHPAPLHNGDPTKWIGKMQTAAHGLPPGLRIINATPNSALTCFEKMELRDALANQPAS